MKLEKISRVEFPETASEKELIELGARQIEKGFMEYKNLNLGVIAEWINVGDSYKLIAAGYVEKSYPC
jgi:hypothetical protein|tara:strand:+ start:1534 stop:1737 length:204 start_codon:yes stop_codon:yes gene_type:complete